MTTYSRENPSPRYVELGRIYRQIHESGLPGSRMEAHDVFAGRSLFDHITPIRDLIRATGARTVLDYGSGKGLLYAESNLRLDSGAIIPTIQEYWAVDEIRCFDPGVPEFAEPPAKPFHGVVCTDVLEHIPEEDIAWFLADLFRFAERFVYANIAAYPATKTLPNGWNAHVTIRPPEWWAQKIHSAAEGWGGRSYEVHVRERRQGFFEIVRHLSRWKTEVITGGR